MLGWRLGWKMIGRCSWQIRWRDRFHAVTSDVSAALALAALPNILGLVKRLGFLVGRVCWFRLWACVVWLILALCLTSCQRTLRPQDSLFQATVQQVISGNTLEVVVPSLANNQLQRVRLIGFDAPAPGQRPWGKAAMDFMRQVDKEAIQLEFDQQQQDSYDRLLAYVWHNGELLNLAMVAEGKALMDSPLPNVRYEKQLRRAQESARLQGLGIWNPANPMRQTPDEFRQLRSQ